MMFGFSLCFLVWYGYALDILGYGSDDIVAPSSPLSGDDLSDLSYCSSSSQRLAKSEPIQSWLLQVKRCQPCSRSMCRRLGATTGVRDGNTSNFLRNAISQNSPLWLIDLGRKWLAAIPLLLCQIERVPGTWFCLAEPIDRVASVADSVLRSWQDGDLIIFIAVPELAFWIWLSWLVVHLCRCGDVVKGNGMCSHALLGEDRLDAGSWYHNVQDRPRVVGVLLIERIVMVSLAALACEVSDRSRVNNNRTHHRL